MSEGGGEVESEEYGGEEPEPPGCRAAVRAIEQIRTANITQSSVSGFLECPPKRTKPVVPQRRSGNGRVQSRTQQFRRTFFPGVSNAEWNDWRWQLRNRIRNLRDLERCLRLSEDERDAVAGNRRPLPLAITPYYASLLDQDNPFQPLRRTVVPTVAEFVRAREEAEDPLGEEAHSPVPNLVHRYPDRILFLVTGLCSSYCRFCTRARIVGHHAPRRFDAARVEAALEYIERTPEIRDVLLSGGDPLTLSDDELEWLLVRLQRIPHVEVVRIGTKVPAVLPQRVTPALVKMLARYHPLWMSIHFTHPDEITPEVELACGRLAGAGIPLGSQTVLLAGINDEVETMRRLVQGLMRIRVRPYYLYQCDPILGSAHFRTPVAKGVEIIAGLRGHTSGYAVPTYVIDAPGGGGKIPLLPAYVCGREGNDLLLANYEGRVFRYPDTAARAPRRRRDARCAVV